MERNNKMKAGRIIFLVLSLLFVNISLQAQTYRVPCSEGLTAIPLLDGFPESDGICRSGTQLQMTYELSAYDPTGSYQFSQNSNWVDRDARTIYIQWNSNWSGTFQFYVRATVYLKHCGVCLDCDEIQTPLPNLFNKRVYTVQRLSPEESAPSLSGLLQNEEVVKGSNINLSWSSYPGTPTYRIDGYPTDVGMPYNTGGLTPGNHTITAYMPLCGVLAVRTIAFTVLPTCAAYNLNSTMLSGSLTGAQTQVVDEGYPSSGGYKVVQDIENTASFSAIPDFWTNYKLTNNAGTNITFTGNNTFKVASGVTLGSFRLDLTTISDPLNRCPVMPPFKVFVGGQDVSFPIEPCIITLPDYLYAKGFTIQDPIILQHFAWKVSSEEGIIVKDEGNGIVLEDGAQLIIDESVKEQLDNQDVDYSRNIINTKIFDDEGNVVSEYRKYYNSSGNIRQTQIKNIEDGVVLAMETLYDQYNRPTVNTLPAPISQNDNLTNSCGGQSLAWEKLQFGYKQNFISTNSNQYSYKNFDGTKLGKPDAIDNTSPGTLGWYYSNNNNSSSTSPYKEPLTDATQYPFSQTEYYTDGTDQLKTTAGPGNVYRDASLGHVHTGKIATEVISAGNADVQQYLTMRAKAFPNDLMQPSDLFENAYGVRYTDKNGIEGFVIYDRTGQKLVVIVDPTGTDKTVAYSFYDLVGRIKYKVTPNGVAGFTGNNFSSIEKTTYTYNHRGWLLSIDEPDRGTTEFKYRNDGNIRFTQDAAQRVASPQRYSYVNYDADAVAVESGEYVVSGTGAVSWGGITSSILENTSSTGGLSTGQKNEVIHKYYHGDNGSNTSPITQLNVIGKISCMSKGNVVTTWFSYDERGRVISMAQYYVQLNKTFITEYTYNKYGKVEMVTFQPNQSDVYYHFYEYDLNTRLSNVYAGPGSTASVENDKQLPNGKYIPQHADYQYYLHGPLKRRELGDSGAKLQGEDYIYTIEGHLKAINNPSNQNDIQSAFRPDVFASSLEYFSGDYSKTGNGINNINYGTGSVDCYNGSIKGINWNYKDATSASAFAYSYDHKNQLTDSKFGTPNFTSKTYTAGSIFDETGMEYDQNGNITSLKRTDASGAVLNDFSNNKYVYNGNKLSSITGYADYSYDASGRVIGIDYVNGNDIYIEYNRAGKPHALYSDASHSTKITEYEYDEGGLRILKKIIGTTTDIENWYVYGQNGSVTGIYQGTVGKVNNTPTDYELIEVPVYGSTRIGTSFRNPTNNFYAYVYELKDHVGSVRALIDRNKLNSDVNILDWTDYYAYGMVMRYRTPKNENYRYGFQGEYAEKDDESGTSNFALRAYDPVIGRWMGPDQYRQFYSSYVGMGNNPVSQVDPDGGYTWLGAWVRNGFSSDGLHYSKSMGEWGFNTGANESLSTNITTYTVGDITHFSDFAITPIYNYGEKIMNSTFSSLKESFKTYENYRAKFADKYKNEIAGLREGTEFITTVSEYTTYGAIAVELLGPEVPIALPATVPVGAVMFQAANIMDTYAEVTDAGLDLVEGKYSDFGKRVIGYTVAETVTLGFVPKGVIDDFLFGTAQDQVVDKVFGSDEK
ncbi:MAG TPA: RHS repeat-associated core domain-containing protein [Cytophagaceae bacterium]|jgi:RHS repeat-associated protein|nr:RHS repeat-associated core domain-containing protein [Cytophagaceae bacterium]